MASAAGGGSMSGSAMSAGLGPPQKPAGLDMSSPAMMEKMKHIPEGKMPRDAFRILNWLFYALALLNVLGRTVIRIRSRRPFLIDDVFVFIAIGSLTAATVLIYKGEESIYATNAAAYNPLAAMSIPRFMDNMIEFQKVYKGFLSVDWVTLFTVKAAFLWLFKQLICRIPLMIRYWWFVVVVTLLSFVFCFGEAYFGCTHSGRDFVKCAEPAILHRVTIFAVVLICLDILTDFLIVSIPVLLLYRVQLRPKRKLRLALFLCLQIVMIAIAIVRASSTRWDIGLDTPWNVSMMQIESCVAVSMLCFTAFRSVFISDDSRGIAGSPHQRWYSSALERVRKFRYRSKESSSTVDSGGFEERLPPIPRGTMTGMRTFVQGRKADTSFLDSACYGEKDEEDQAPIYPYSDRGIRVERTMSHSIF